MPNESKRETGKMAARIIKVLGRKTLIHPELYFIEQEDGSVTVKTRYGTYINGAVIKMFEKDGNQFIEIKLNYMMKPGEVNDDFKNQENPIIIIDLKTLAPFGGDLGPLGGVISVLENVAGEMGKAHDEMIKKIDEDSK